MSKLPMANFKTMDKILMVLALPPCAKKGVMFFIAMQTAGRRRFPIMETGILPDRSCVRFCGKSPFPRMSLWNCSKNFSHEKASQPNTPRGVFFIFGTIDSTTTQTTPRWSTTPCGRTTALASPPRTSARADPRRDWWSLNAFR